MEKDIEKKQLGKEEKETKHEERGENWLPVFPQRVVSLIADEVVKTLYSRIPSLLPATAKKRPVIKSKKIDYAVFLDTSAIIDGRILDLIQLGVVNGTLVINESILLELKHIADSQNTVKRERGRKGLERLEALKKTKGIKIVILPEDAKKEKKVLEVDEKLIRSAKIHKGKLITCDYNLEKKAIIEGVSAINVNAIANALKVIAVPGEAVHINVQHIGKDVTQGVGYLDDGTMVVVEQGSADIGMAIDVVVARVIQTASGRILFAKKI